LIRRIIIAMDGQFLDSTVEKSEDILDDLLLLPVKRKVEIKFIDVPEDARWSIYTCKLLDC